MADRYASLKQGLVGCWIPSVSGSGLLLPDLSGRGNSGSLVGMDASDWVSSQYGRALDFDGVNDLVSISTTGQSQFCVSLWFRIRAFKALSTDGVVLAITNGANDNLYIAQRASGSNTLTCNAFDGTVRGIYGTGPALSVNVWTHAVCIAANGLYQIYINGSKTTETAGTVVSSTANTITIGNYTDGLRPGDQLIDDVRLYNRALTEPEIRLLASRPGIGFKRISSSAFATRYAYKPAKPRNYSVIRNRDPNYSTLRQGLVAAYCPSISGQGNVLPDLVGGNHGTLTSMDASDWVSSGDGRALDFDGSNDGVVTTDSSAITTNRLTISCWLRPNVLTRGDLVTRWTNGVSTGDQFNLLYGLTSGKPQFYVSTGTFVPPDYPNSGVGSDAMSVGQWNHIVGVYDGSTVAVWLNGKFQASSAYSGTINTASGSVTRIGRNGSTDGFTNGQLDDVRLYSRALTEPEIKLLASKRGIGLQPRNTHVTFADLGVQKTYSVVRVKETDYATLRQGLVGAWCPSLPNGGSGNTLPDVSGYNNHGVLTNMSPDDWVSGQYGRALDFDGVNDSVTLNGIQNTTGQPITFSSYIRTPTSAGLTDQRFVGVSDGSAEQFVLRINFNDLQILQATSVNWQTIATSVFTANEWLHLCVVASATQTFVYRNGFLYQTTNAASQTRIEQNRFGISVRFQNTFGQFFVGQFNDMRLYSRALSESEIKLLASRPGIGLRQESHRQTFYQFPSGARRKRILTGMP